jgi:hypothetical protein
MAILKTKEFIQKVLIDEVGTVVNSNPYLSFIIMSTSIEFLGKCLNTDVLDWNDDGRPTVDFTHAINTIPSLQKYHPYLRSHKLYGSFRCGLAHSAAPKESITLSSGDEAAHLTENDGRLNLKVEVFYKDFKEACEFVNTQVFSDEDKMNSPFLEIPDANSSAPRIIATGMTQTYLYTGAVITNPPAASGTISRR